MSAPKHSSYKAPASRSTIESPATRMCPSTLPCRRLLFVLLIISTAAAQTNKTGPSRPTVGIVIGIFMVMLTLTVLFLVYSRFCHAIATELFAPVSTAFPEDGLLPLHASRVHKTLIESLPVFRFASLKGAREGLECAVCLAAFEDADILRLLPKCKHAFHVDCVDRWLKGHTSCPLCRHRVDVEESAEFSNYSSSRSLHLQNQAYDADIDQFQMFVEREPVARCSSSRSATGGSLLRINDNESVLMAQEPVELAHNKLKHRIIASDVVFKTRWSDVNSSDLMSLSSDMLSVMSSKRFDPESSDFWINSTTERRVDEKALMTGGKRCLPEIADVPRFGIEPSGDDKIGSQSDQNRREEHV